MTTIDARAARGLRATAVDRSHTREGRIRFLLTTILVVVLWRATGMWYGYPARFDEGVEVDPTAMRVLLYSLIPLLAVYFAIDYKQFAKSMVQTSWVVSVILLACLGSIVLSIDVGASIRGAAAVALLAMGALTFRLRYGGAATYRLLINFITWTAFANILYLLAFPQFAIMGGSYAGDVKGLFYHKNGLGQFSAVSFLILTVWMSLNLRLTREFLVRGLAALCLLVLVVLCNSSTALVMVFVGLALMVFLRSFGGVKGSLFRATLALSTCVLFGVMASYLYMEIAQTIAASFGKDLTFSGRSDIWDALVPLIYDRPWLGYGFAVFRQSYVLDQYIHLGHGVLSVHNTYLELALNIGVPAMIMWCLFVLGRVLRKVSITPTNAATKQVQSSDIIVLILVLVGAMTEAGLMMAPVIMWPIFVAALPMDGASAPQRLPAARRRLFRSRSPR